LASLAPAAWFAQAMNTRYVSLLLLASGACALVLQTAWLREFRLVFGASTPAMAAVLAIFMGGLGVGNLVLGKRADAVANPLRFFAQLELAICVIGIASPFLVQLIRGGYLALGGQEALGVVGATAVRLALSALVIGPPTFLMGGTLAAAARAVTTADDESRRDVGWLYGMNTLGAVAGALLSTFLLLEWLGHRETLFAAGGVGLLNAAAAWWLSERLPSLATQASESKSTKPTRSSEKQRRESSAPLVASPLAFEPAVAPSLVYIAAFVVGFVFFLMELVWYRMLGAILGGTTFTLGLILTMALAGIGVGGAVYPAFFRSRVPTVRDFALTCGCEALALAIPFALGDRLALLAYVLQGMRYFGFAGQVLGWSVIAAIVVFPAGVAAGVQLPVLIALLGRGSRDVGRQVGLALAWNTLGAVLGSLAGGFGLLPLLSAMGAWKLAAMVLIAAAFAAMWLTYQRERQASPLLAPAFTTAAAALCLVAIGPTSVWRHSSIGAGRARPPAAHGASANDLK
jgi:spermidine synthase